MSSFPYYFSRCLPPPGRVQALGELYVNLYTSLWDEDESMMVRRAAAALLPALDRWGST